MSAEVKDAPKPQVKQTASAEQFPVTTIQHAAGLLGAPKGERVLFYQDGDKTGDSMPAVVRFCHQNGVLDLTIFRAGDSPCRYSVKHVDDPTFADNPHHRKQFGAWDYSPGLRPKTPKAVPFEVDAMAKAVVQHWNNGVEDPHVIAQRAKVSIERALTILSTFAPGFRQ